MKTSVFSQIAGASIAAALISCSGVPTTPLVQMPPSARTHVDRDSSWMSSGAKAAPRLLYVSDLQTFDVYVYRFPSLKLSGKLTGFDDPQGECTDAGGNVWIANTQANEMLEYAHGGVSPIASLSDPLGFPVGCAIDPTSGNLAVANLDDYSGAGSVLVYPNAAGTPRAYGNPSIAANYFAAYDRKGNLYVSGASHHHGYLLAMLLHGSSSISLLSIKGGTLYFPGTVAWNGSTLVLGDQECKKKTNSCFYELSVSGKTATITGTTPLSGSCDVAQAWVGATQIAGGNDAQSCGPGKSSVGIWPYPAGGNPDPSVAGPQAPVGATVSSAGS
jgi:hypothetical protein